MPKKNHRPLQSRLGFTRLAARLLHHALRALLHERPLPLLLDVLLLVAERQRIGDAQQ